MDKIKTILATAYAVNPYKGSEDGMGWNFIKQIARHNKVIAITRENNKQHVERYMHEKPDVLYNNIKFLYFDLPYWMRFWKKGSRGAMLYFWLWQRAIPGFVKRQRLKFDIVHNVNFHNDWTPSYLWKLEKPFVWGPIGHHPRIPFNFLKTYPLHYLLKDNLTWLVKKYFWKLSMPLRNTVKHADHILCMNTEVKEAIHLRNKRWSIMPSVATEDFGHQKKINGKFTIISAGRLVPLKGFDLTLMSFADFMKTVSESDKQNCELVIVGSGPEKALYEDIVHKNNLHANVRFIEWIPREDLLNLYQQCSVFLFPSHEGAGMVVGEALSCGVPVICLDNAGPGEFIDESSGIAVQRTSVQETIRGLSTAIQILYNNPSKLDSMRVGARKRFEEHFDWNKRGDQLNQIYQSLSL
jgi:glycosyltransferase involved in cell wall biosynthesis